MLYTVSQITAYLKNLLEGQAQLRSLEVEGEISEYRRSSQLYFTITDGDAKLPCVMFADSARRGLTCSLAIGKRVRVSGRITVYANAGRYQLYASRVEEVGRGPLNEQLQQLARRLKDEGLFDREHKKPLPPYPKRVGLVTANNSAVLEDMRRVFRERNPYIQLVLSPCRVQGNGAAKEICRAIRRAARADVDVIIVGRGGGSRDDLLEFSDEQLVRTVYACEVPIVSAVGHEIDYMLIDYVADVQVQTPTAAAERVAYPIDEFLRTIADRHYALVNGVCRSVEVTRDRLARLQQGLRHVSPAEQLRRRREILSLGRKSMNSVMRTAIADERRETTDAERELRHRMRESLISYKNRLGMLETGLAAMSPYRLLEQGYAFVTVDGRPVKGIADLPAGALMKGYLADGSFEATIVSSQPNDEG
ncbi:MAG: exodeoxyribonuclease VII large subunit [Lachnospiraceae bacterium]|nr:exodeoxyribonuclease VII large subunit [Lachnospiraceae bacterium]